jgi:hypothetical protein
VSRLVVRGQFVFDRHAATELSVAYGILVPQQPSRAVRAGPEGVAHDQQCGDDRSDLRPGVLSPAEEGRDDRFADGGPTRPRGRVRAAGA